MSNARMCPSGKPIETVLMANVILVMEWSQVRFLARSHMRIFDLNNSVFYFNFFCDNYGQRKIITEFSLS